ncbi:hypothetical protein MMC22_003862 [Lobaria immixta]|nr:hypothetical protein [Lobaria immixta]
MRAKRAGHFQFCPHIHLETVAATMHMDMPEGMSRDGAGKIPSDLFPFLDLATYDYSFAFTNFLNTIDSDSKYLIETPLELVWNHESANPYFITSSSLPRTTTTLLLTRSSEKVNLAKPADWDAWISFLRTRATKNKIWDPVNPDLSGKPTSLEAPKVPELTIPDDHSLFDMNANNALKAQKMVYKIRVAEYERQNEAFGDLISCIQDTTPLLNFIFLLKTEEPHPWNFLRGLKRRFGPCHKPPATLFLP